MSASSAPVAHRPPVAPPEPTGPRGVAAAAPAEAGAVVAAPGPNPSLRIDPLLGIVVLEFQDAHGGTSTLPTQRALAAYRRTGLPQHEHAGAHAGAHAASHGAPNGAPHGATSAAGAAGQAAPAEPARPAPRAPELATKA